MAHKRLDRRLLSAIHKLSGPAHVRMELGDSPRRMSMWPTLPIVRLKNRKTLIAVLLNPEMNFGDLYSQGDIQVEGDLVRALEALYQAPDRLITRFLSHWLQLAQSCRLQGARKNIHHHYDIPTDFYKLWLDPELVYTCAYFPDESASLETAQRAKLDLVCRKLWLQPGETVVEAGCGWGALSLHMAREYGVRVKAFNISHEQIAFARERAKREGLQSRVEFIEDDYRNIADHYDAFVSVGMLEHIGREHYQELGNVIHRSIGDTGRGLLHFIGKSQPQPFSVWIRKRIFPGAYTPTLREAMDVLEPHDFSVLDVENLRMHYARTTEFWLQRYERCFDQVVERFGLTFARMWRLYLAGSIAGFRVGTLQLFQIVFAGRACKSQPWTRAHLYNNNAIEQDSQDVQWIRATS
jgi:cyclopropane-fatty-acyl-phospholipid synthase